MMFYVFYRFYYFSLPICYRIIFGSIASSSSSSSSSSASASSIAETYYALQMLFPLFAGVTYGAHIPERLAPGRFDFFASSHQLFHLVAVARTYFQCMALETEIETMRTDILRLSGTPTFWATCGCFLIKICIEVVIILVVIQWLRKPYQLIRIKKNQGISTIDIDEK